MLWERERKYPNQHPSWLAYAGIVMCLIVVFFLMNHGLNLFEATNSVKTTGDSLTR